MTAMKCQCCFCGETIARTRVDPCAVILVGNWQSPDPAGQAQQQFFCHVTCFKDAVWQNVPVDVESPLEERP